MAYQTMKMFSNSYKAYLKKTVGFRTSQLFALAKVPWTSSICASEKVVAFLVTETGEDRFLSPK